jgi:hypothetical protein
MKGPKRQASKVMNNLTKREISVGENAMGHSIIYQVLKLEDI